MSIVSTAVGQYFQDRHPTLNQPDLITFHVEFLSKADMGNATVSVQPLKLGRQFSTVRVNLIQRNEAKGKTTVCLEALVTQGNLAVEAKNGGIDLETKGLLDKKSIPKRETCEKWVTDPRWYSRRFAAFKIEMYLPEGSDSLCVSPTEGPGVREQWVRWTPGVGTTFSNASLAFLADCFRPLPEAYGVTNCWFPTLSYGLDVKRAAPVGGWEWLFVRIDMGMCRNGRHDYSVVIADEQGEVVAVSRHTTLIVSADRNFKPSPAKI
jgi:acyl-CoA thioesterase